MNDETHGDDRARKLVELLRGLGARITSIAGDADPLAESRRVVEAAQQRSEHLQFGTGEFELDNDGDEPWQHRT